MSDEYELASHNGMAVFSLPDLPVITGSLVFAVGMRDETARSAGCAHLVEHLVMSRVRARGQSVNAVTSDGAVVFTARGDADLVARFLGDVARAINSLSSITADEIVAQQRIIAAELGENHSLPGAGPFSERFGAKGLGLLDLGSPAHTALGVEEVVAFARRWLHRANAAIVLTGMGIDLIDVSLPSRVDDSALDRDPCVDTGAAGWTGSATPGVTLSMLVGDGPTEAILLAIGVIHNTLLSELRHERQILYAVEVFVAEWSRTALFASFHLDVPAERTDEVARLAVDLLHRIESSGADAEARREYEEDWRRISRDAENRAEALLTHAAAVLRETSRTGKRPVDPSTVSDSTLGEIFRTSLKTLLVSIEATALSDDVEKRSIDLGLAFVSPPQSHYARLSRVQLVRQFARPSVKVFSPRPLRGLGGTQVIVDDERIAFASQITGVLDIPFSEIALARHDQGAGSWSIVSSRGDIIGIDESDWRGGRALGRLLDERIPLATRYAPTM